MDCPDQNQVEYVVAQPEWRPHLEAEHVTPDPRTQRVTPPKTTATELVAHVAHHPAIDISP